MPTIRMQVASQPPIGDVAVTREREGRSLRAYPVDGWSGATSEVTRMRSRVSRLVIGIEMRDGVRVLHLAGQLDVYTSMRLRRSITGWEAQAQPLVINLLRVDLIDSSGLAVLARLQGRPGIDDGAVALVSSGLVRDVLHIAGLGDPFVHAPDVGGACDAVRGGPSPRP